MAKTLTYIVFFMFLLAGSLSVSAQETPTVKASVDKNQILIGEPIRFTIDVKSPWFSGNELPQFDSIPHFEMIEKANRDSADFGCRCQLSSRMETDQLRFRNPYHSGVFSNDRKTGFIKRIQLPSKFPMAKWIRPGTITISRESLTWKIRMSNIFPGSVGAIALIALVLFIWFIPPTA